MTAAGYDPIDVNASSVGLIILLVLGILLLIAVIVIVIHYIRKMKREVQLAQTLRKKSKDDEGNGTDMAGKTAKGDDLEFENPMSREGSVQKIQPQNIFQNENPQRIVASSS